MVAYRKGVGGVRLAAHVDNEPALQIILHNGGLVEHDLVAVLLETRHKVEADVYPI